MYAEQNLQLGSCVIVDKCVALEFLGRTLALIVLRFHTPDTRFVDRFYFVDAANFFARSFGYAELPVRFHHTTSSPIVPLDVKEDELLLPKNSIGLLHVHASAPLHDAKTQQT